jgi:hypothetical protein
LLQLTSPGIGSKDEIKDPTPFPLSIEEEYFNDDSSKAPTCDIKDLKFEPAGQDLEKLLASKENILELSTIIIRNWSIAIEEDDNFIKIYPDAKVVCCCLQGFCSRWFAMTQDWDSTFFYWTKHPALICNHLYHQLGFYSGSQDRTCNGREWFPLPQQSRQVRCAWSTTSLIALVRLSPKLESLFMHCLEELTTVSV